MIVVKLLRRLLAQDRHGHIRLIVRDIRECDGFEDGSIPSMFQLSGQNGEQSNGI
jgi:hypothetical protein